MATESLGIIRVGEPNLGYQDVALQPSTSWFNNTFLKIVFEAMTSGLLQTCKVWLGVSKGMFPVKQLHKKILMAVNYCGRQLVRRIGWAASAYHKNISHFQECANIACSMTGGLMGGYGCGLGRGI